MISRNKTIIIFIIIAFFLLIITFGFKYSDGKNFSKNSDNGVILDNLVGMNIDDVKEYANKNHIKLRIEYKYNSFISKYEVISQNKEVGDILNENDTLLVVVSNGDVPVSVYQEYQVNELGKVPIMMYHGIVDIRSEDTDYVGGNFDKDGYNRTVDAFREDLEFYYSNNYRMIRLIDYVNGEIDVEIGKSPIILTFDDGNENNFKVLEKRNGELVIDPNCAIGVLEEFKKKYPDFGVTATFFVNSGLFGQEKYNEDILKWLIEHDYDIGNHTMTHCDFTMIGIEDVKKEVGGLYQLLHNVIGDNYVNIVALPFGSPYSRDHVNYDAIIDGGYLGVDYYTKAVLRVGWEAEVSCFDINFNPTYLKRIRAYDNNGLEFDIEMNFNLLQDNRYVSDGDSNTVVILKEDMNRISQFNKDNYKIIYY